MHLKKICADAWAGSVCRRVVSRERAPVPKAKRTTETFLFVTGKTVELSVIHTSIIRAHSIRARLCYDASDLLEALNLRSH